MQGEGKIIVEAGGALQFDGKEVIGKNSLVITQGQVNVQILNGEVEIIPDSGGNGGTIGGVTVYALTLYEIIFEAGAVGARWSDNKSKLATLTWDENDEYKTYSPEGLDYPGYEFDYWEEPVKDNDLGKYICKAKWKLASKPNQEPKPTIPSDGGSNNPGEKDSPDDKDNSNEPNGSEGSGSTGSSGSTGGGSVTPSAPARR